MLVLMILAFMAVPLAAWNYPAPSVEKAENGFQFILTHVTGIKKVFFNYLPHKDGRPILPRFGSAFRDGKGQWRFQDPDLVLSYGDKILFSATVWGSQGKDKSEEQTWIYAPQAIIQTRPLRATVLFREDFNGRIDLNIWKYEVSMFGGRNWEFQVYTPETKNVYTQNGNLYLRPTFTVDDPRFDENFLNHGVLDVAQIWGDCTNNNDYGCSRDGKYGMLPPIMSGKLSSRPTAKFGVIEVRAKPPKGDWIWPALWMMPKDSKYGDWPRSGEIDIMETRGNSIAKSSDGVSHGINEVSSTLHWGTLWNDNHYAQTHGEKRMANGDWHGDFHTWRMEWTADHIITSVDNQEILRVTPPAGGFHELGKLSSNPWVGASKMAPFDQDFYFMANVAVGGTNGYFPDNFDYGVQKPWPNNSPHANADFWGKRGDWQKTWVGDGVAMQVDYVEFRSG